MPPLPRAGRVRRALVLTIALTLVLGACGHDPVPVFGGAVPGESAEGAVSPPSAGSAGPADPAEAADAFGAPDLDIPTVPPIEGVAPSAAPDERSESPSSDATPSISAQASGDGLAADMQSVSIDLVDHGVAAAAWSPNVAVVDNGDGTITVSTDGLPDHEIDALVALRGDDKKRGVVRPNPAEPEPLQITLPADPQIAAEATATPRGVIGVLLSGAPLYGPFDRNGSLVVDTNFEISGAWYLDACNGHASKNGTYHYHGVPYCITDAVDVPGEHSRLIGVLADGFPVYGPQDVGGLPPTDLDACNGHVGPTPEFPAGTYHYHLLETGTYGVTCLRGTPQLFVDDVPDPVGSAPGGGADPATSDAAIPGVAEDGRSDGGDDSDRDRDRPRYPDQTEAAVDETATDREPRVRSEATDRAVAPLAADGESDDDDRPRLRSGGGDDEPGDTARGEETSEDRVRDEGAERIDRDDDREDRDRDRGDRDGRERSPRGEDDE